MLRNTRLSIFVVLFCTLSVVYLKISVLTVGFNTCHEPTALENNQIGKLENRDSDDILSQNRESDSILSQNRDSDNILESIKYTKKNITMLYWNPFFNREDWWKGYGSHPFRKCLPPYDSVCSTSGDRSSYGEVDAILVSIFNIHDADDLPKWRNPNHTWVMGMWESPLRNKKDFAQFNGQFNISMTYAQKSDVYMPYVQCRRRSRGGLQTTSHVDDDLDFHSGRRSKDIVWIVSNCHTQSGREHYVQELKKYINVDIYGKCGNLKCPRDGKDCKSILYKYKFYLSFENSICEDYMTEKVEIPILNNLIPVVMGGANYSNVLPRGSYIDVRDYESPAKLAAHLKQVGSDHKLYSSYFKWKKDNECKKGFDFCALCEYLYNHQGEKRVIDRLDLFWNSQTDCQDQKHYIGDGMD